MKQQFDNPHLFIHSINLWDEGTENKQEFTIAINPSVNPIRRGLGPLWENILKSFFKLFSSMISKRKTLVSDFLPASSIASMLRPTI